MTDNTNPQDLIALLRTFIGDTQIVRAARAAADMLEELSTCKLCRSTGHDTPCAYPTEINRQQAKRIAELEVLATTSGSDPDHSEDMDSHRRLPGVAHTRDGKRLYAMAYARGRVRGRLESKGAFKPSANAEVERKNMRIILPEGGALTVQWPDWLTADSALMLSEMFDAVMKAFAKAASPDAAISASQPKNTEN